nr:retrovirus-related Pol polyprotein from transposon TNT 1-94 [Tanacetum cinerariifolium]
IDEALEEIQRKDMKDDVRRTMRKNASSTIRLALYPEIKYNILKEKTSKDIWDKLTNIYASNSLMHRLFLKKELHSMKLEEGGEEQALLMLSSLTTSYKSFVQTMLTGRSTLTCEDVLKALRDNEQK